MSVIKGSREIAAVDKLLKVNAVGSWFLKTELKEYMDEKTMLELSARLDKIFNKAVVVYGKTFTPDFRINRLKDADTMHPKAILQMLRPASRMTMITSPVLVTELELDLNFTEHGIVLTLKKESDLEAHIRVNGWKVNDEELKLLEELAALTAKLNQSKHFRVQTQFEDEGLVIQTNYKNPVDQVRAVLAR